MQEIIIDGVDVAECEYYQYKTDEDVKMRHPQSGDCSIGLCAYLFDCTGLIDDMEKHCIDNPNCYFKQLQRLKKGNELIKQSNQDWGLTVTKLRAENEELKIKLMQQDEVNTLMSNLPWNDNPCDICRYKQALEKISKYCKPRIMLNGTANTILKIIESEVEE